MAQGHVLYDTFSDKGIMDMSEIILYHGTDMSCAKKIIDEGFEVRPNPEHWLGNGVYFYEDFALAKWWTTNPSKKFGARITDKAIVKCKINYNESNILNLRLIDEYEFFMQQYFGFLESYALKGPRRNLRTKEFRCTFCDFVQSRFDYEMFIGTFYEPNQPYLPPEYKSFLGAVHLPYIEVQHCVFNEKIIEPVEIIEI